MRGGFSFVRGFIRTYFSLLLARCGMKYERIEERTVNTLFLIWKAMHTLFMGVGKTRISEGRVQFVDYDDPKSWDWVRIAQLAQAQLESPEDRALFTPKSC